MLKNRFPNIFKSEQINVINKMLSRPIEKSKKIEDILFSGQFSHRNSFSATDNSTDQLCFSSLLSYVSENGKAYPVEIGENYTEAQRNKMAEYLVRFWITFCLSLLIDWLFFCLLRISLGVQAFIGLQIESLHTITGWVFSNAMDVTRWWHRFRIYIKNHFIRYENMKICNFVFLKTQNV